MSKDKSQLDETINEYFIKRKNEINKIFDPDKNYNYKMYSGDTHIIEIYDNNKMILKAEYDLIGIYNIFNSIWYWAWNIQFVDRSLAKNSEKVKKFAKELNDKYDDYLKNNKMKVLDNYYYICKNGNFYTSSDNILKMIKLMMYLTDGLWYIPICLGKDDVTCVVNEKDGYPSALKRMEYLMIKKVISF